MTMKKVSIALDIQLLSPLHITSMESARFIPGEPKHRQIRRTDDKVGLPVTLTRELSIVLDKPQNIEAGEASFTKTVARVPVIPANGLGGRLRRCAAELIVDQLQASGQTLSVRAFNTLSTGAPDASLKRADADIEQVMAGKANPYFGVFGGSSYALTSDLVVHEGYPLSAMTANLLRTPALLDAVPEVSDLDMTLVIPLVRKDDVKDVKDPARLEAAIGTEAVTDYIDEIMQGREEKHARKKDEDDQGKKTELTSVSAIHAVTPGLHFALRFDLVVRSEAHLGLFLLALQRFCDPVTGGQMGGKGAKGFGRFKVAASQLSYASEAGHEAFNLLSINSMGECVFADNDVIQSAVLAGQAFIAEVQSATLEKFAAPDANVKFKTRAPRKPKAKPGDEAQAAPAADAQATPEAAAGAAPETANAQAE